MTLAIRVDGADPTPPYEQIRRQVAGAVASGVLAPGTRLPTVRQLAGDLGVATGTVMRAYSELEAAAVVVTGRGAGTVVAPRPAPPPGDRSDALDSAAHRYAEEARRLGVGAPEALAAVAKVLGV